MEDFLFESFKLSFSFHDIAVVPLDITGFLEPSSEICDYDFVHVVIELWCIFEFTSSDIETVFIETCSTPEHESYSFFLFAVSDDRIVLEEPDWMLMPDFSSSFWKWMNYLFSESFTDGTFFILEMRFIIEDVRWRCHDGCFFLSG